MVHRLVGFFARKMAAMRVLTQEYDALEGGYRDKIRELRLEYSNLCTEILRELRRSTGAGDVAPLNVAASALFGMMNSIHARYQASTVPAERVAEHLYRLFVGGFVGRVG